MIEMKKKIRIFGDKFVSNNENNCKIIFNNQIIDLVTTFDVQNYHHYLIFQIGILIMLLI